MIHSRYTKALIGILILDLTAAIYTIFLIPGVFAYYTYFAFGMHFVASVFVLFFLAIYLSVRGSTVGPAVGLVIGVIFVYGATVYPIGLRALPLGVILGIPTISVSLLAFLRRL